MAIVDVITTQGALASRDRARLSTELAAMTVAAEGFAGSAVAPGLCRTFFEERPLGAFSTGAGEPPAPLYHVTVSALQGAIAGAAKRELGRRITGLLLAAESPGSTDEASRVWVRFIEIADGDLVVGGEATSLGGLRALIADER